MRSLSFSIARARFALLLLAISSAPALAQIDTGTIQGIITDEQGAVIPGANIVVVNVETNQRVETPTNDQGFYTASKLKVGHYRVEASLPGFKTAVRTGILLEVQRVARVDFTLQIGEISEQVTVTDEAALLETETSAVGQVIHSRIISDLPLNGRQYVQLARLAAGVVEPPRGDRGRESGFVANGVRAQLNDFRLDGIDNNARTPGMQQRSYDVVRPSVDAIQHFRVETHNFSAEFGRAAGAVINVVTKSGTNEFHGSLFEFHRNDNLDARHFFAPREEPKPLLIRNQFGGTLGGPIVKDTAFFFFSYEGTRERRGLTLTNTVPTRSMRDGDFSGVTAIYDPLTTRANPKGKGFIRDRFPGDRIPRDRFDPVAVKLMNELLLLPNQPGMANNFILNANNRFDVDDYMIRTDATLSPNDRVFGRYSLRERTLIDPEPFWIGGARSDAVRAQSAVIGETHTFGRGTINELRLGYNRVNPVRDLLVKEQLFEQFGFKGINPPSDVTGIPRIGISGFVELGNGTFHPNQKIPENFEVSDNVSFVRGNHSLTAGLTFRYQKNFFNISDIARGNFVFNGVFTQNPQKRGNTGSEFADFLLGFPHNAVLSNKFDGHMRNHYWGIFVQDHWKVSSRLTINLGIRYELFYPEYEIDDKQLNFALGPNKLIVPNDQLPEGIRQDLVMPIPNGVGSRRLRRLDKNNFAPRLGLAYHLASRTVIRAGGGIFYAEGVSTFLGGASRLVGNPPWRINKQFISDRLFPTEVSLSKGFPPNILVIQTVSPNTTWRSWDLDMPSPYASHWSLNVQHELPGWFLLDAGYNGSKGTNFDVDFDANAPLPGAGSVAKRRPLQVFGSINRWQGMSNSQYHALVLRAERRFSEGLAFLLGYTYGKGMDDMGEQFSDQPVRDVRNIKAERARSNFDIRHRVVASYIWDLPFGSNRHWDLGSAWLNDVLGNWQFNGITILRTGQPFTPNMGFSTANTGHARPNRTCDGNLVGDQRSIDGWFDKSCFPAADATKFEFGNAGRNILDGPGQVNFDLSLFKRVPVAALGERGEVQFRVEFFNAFNTPQFARPDTRVDRGRGATIRSLQNNMREIQFGLKILF